MRTIYDLDFEYVPRRVRTAERWLWFATGCCYATLGLAAFAFGYAVLGPLIPLPF